MPSAPHPKPPAPSARTPDNLVNDPRHVVIVATPHASALEVAGPAEAFALVRHKLQEQGRVRARPYEVHLLSAQAQNLELGGSGIGLKAHGSYAHFDQPIDTLLVAGGMDIWTGRSEPAFLNWLKTAAASARRVGSICTGAFVLAEAGLLQDCRVTTHWYFCDQLQREYPKLKVDAEPIFVRQDRLWTAAGVTTGMDLALSMIEEDLGMDIALRIARGLVLYLRRPGWQAQFSSALALQTSSRLPFRDLPFWILENLREPLPTQRMAERAAMSPRNFNRRFVEEFGCTPVRFVSELRTQTARRLMLESHRSRAEVAAECGFGSVDAMERALKRYPPGGLAGTKGTP